MRNRPIAPWRSISTLGGVTPLSFKQALNAVKSKLPSSVRNASFNATASQSPQEFTSPRSAYRVFAFESASIDTSAFAFALRFALAILIVLLGWFTLVYLFIGRFFEQRFERRRLAWRRRSASRGSNRFSCTPCRSEGLSGFSFCCLPYPDFLQARNHNFSNHGQVSVGARWSREE
jgi:hypothetical protein